MQTLAAPRRLHLKLDAGQHLPHVYVDPRRLQQILSNIISNAVKFTPDGGTITLGVRLREARLSSNDAARGDAGPQPAVEFFVSDTGVGIRPEVVRHIFDRFHQGDASTTRRYGGLGIGLSVVRGLVELQGGRVWAESDGDGRGATFVVRFPAADAARQVRATKAGAADETARASESTGRDDSADTLGVVRAMLEDAGYEVEIADSADGALAAARRFAPDCILSDLGMPERDGFSLMETLRADPALRAAPVIALTGFVTHPDREAALSAGFRAHLPKPVEQRALVNAINEALAGEG